MFTRFIITVLLLGCSGHGQVAKERQEPGIRYSDVLSPQIKNKLKDALNWTSKRAHAQKYSRPTAFVKVFGRPSFDAVNSFLLKRIHFFINHDRNWDREMGLPQSTVNVSPASNISSTLWALYIDRIAKGESAARLFTIDDVPINLNQNPLGVIRIDPNINDQMADLELLRILVHEARHSDCSGGLLKRNPNPRTNKFEDKYNLVPNSSCFYQHTICRAGEMKGQGACDDVMWGAYTLEYIFLREVMVNCENCGKDEVQLAAQLALTRIGRLQYLPKTIRSKYELIYSQFVESLNGKKKLDLHELNQLMNLVDTFLLALKPEPNLTSTFPIEE